MLLGESISMLTIIDTIPEIQKKVNKAFAEEINKVLTKNKTNILQRCREFSTQSILLQPEVQSLSSMSVDSLAGQFGLTSAQALAVPNAIASAIESSISVSFVPYNSALAGGLEVNFQPSNFRNLLDLPIGHVVYDNGDLHWLSWLLEEGDRVIVLGYSYDPTTGLGRSGLGTMTSGGFFRVPPQFSGTIKNNFVTKALTGVDLEKQISNLFKSILGAK